MDEGEGFLEALSVGDYSSDLLFVFENGKAARIPLSAYATKSRRRKLTGAYSDKSQLIAVIPLEAETEIFIESSDGRALIFSAAAIAPKATRSTQGVAVMSLKSKRGITRALPAKLSAVQNLSRYKVRRLPAAGALLKTEDRGDIQLEIED
jgi:DNA gyrase subunit A